MEYETTIVLEFPIQWVPLLSFFDPELPGFPLHRVHSIMNSQRVIGIPITYSIGNRDGETCKLDIHVLSNVDLSSENSILRNLFVGHLKERLGLSQAQNLESLKEYCEGCEHWERIVELVFPRLRKYYGNFLPCGQFYPELYGILRFISAWNTTRGRKQELIMLNNLLSTIGTRVNNCMGWEGLNLFLVPSYVEAIAGKTRGFDRFEDMKNAVLEYGNTHLTEEYSAGDKTLYLLDLSKEIPKNQESWDTLLQGLSKETQVLIVQIKEDFNRNYQRPFVFITYMYNILKEVNFSEWNKDDYARIIKDKPRGIYPKVLGCFLQQAFGKYGCIPIDIWVASFFEEVLQVPKVDIVTSGNNLGKFERFIWNTVQLRKTNQPFFNDILFCIKTGVLHSKSVVIRRVNPLSCSLCAFRIECPTYASIEQSYLAVVCEDDIVDRPRNLRVLDSSRIPKRILRNLRFVLTIDTQGRPNEVLIPRYKKDRNTWKLTDNMSRFKVNVSLNEGIFKVEELNL